MKQNRLLLSFDVEEFDLPEEFGVFVSPEERNLVSVKGTEVLLDVLEETHIRATMFVTGFFAERNPEIIRRMTAHGHEIASHGMNHSFFEASHLKESKELLEKISGQTVTGFRMARLAPVEKSEILSAGYEYESSLNPVWLPGRYNHFRAPLLPFQEVCGLWQLPVSAVPLIRFPLFWLTFKNLFLSSYRMLCRSTIARTGYFNMYSHPWEYNEAARDPRWKIPGYIVRHAGPEQADRLKTLICDLKNRGSFITFHEYLHPEMKGTL